MSQEEIIRVTVQLQQALAQFDKLKGKVDEFRRTAQQGFGKAGAAILQAEKGIFSLGRNTGTVFARIGSAILQMPGKIRAFGASLTALGSRIQFLGFRLIVGLTLPILRVGQASVRTALDIEKEWIRVQKVYGDSTVSAADFAKVQTEVLRPEVLRMSKEFKEHQTVILGVMGTYAAAGKQGKELADITRETLRVATLGEIDLGQATNFVKNIMATFGLTAAQVKREIDAFNRIENETFLQMKDLTRAFPIAAGAFKGFNLTAREGAAVLAGITQRTGTANEAANASKFVFSRLASGMKPVNDTLQQLGIRLFDMAGKARPGVTVLKEMATKLKGLSDQERQEAMSRLFGNRQIVRMRALMEAVLDPTSDFTKALKISQDDTQNAAVAFRELNTILESQPKTWEGAQIAIENVLAVIGQQLAPIVIDITKRIAQVAEAFVSLPKGVQMGIIAFLAFLAAIGPILFLGGQFLIVVGALTTAFGILLTPIGLLVGALVGLGIIFGMAALGSEGMRDDMINAFNAIKTVFLDVWEKNLKPALETTKEIVKSVAETFADNWEKIKTAFEITWIFLKPALEFLWDILVTLVGIIVEQFKPAWDELFAAIKPILPILAVIAGILGVGLLAAILGIAAVLAGLSKAFTSFVVGLVNIFSGLLQTIRGALEILVGLFTGNFDLVKKGWNNLISGMGRIAKGMFQATLGVVFGFVKGVLSFFVNLVSRIIGVDIPKLINGIVTWFKSLPRRIVDNIKFIGTEFAKLASKAVTWGKDLVRKFVEGIKSLGPWFKDQLLKIIPGPVKKVLGFSLPKEGPLRETGKWMPHMIQLLTRSLESSAPRLIGAVDRIAAQTAGAFGTTPTTGLPTAQTLTGRPGIGGGPVFVDQSFVYQPNQSFATPQEIRNLERQLMVARRQETIRRGE
jgi:TP901 family phage tail tape measure protein